MNYAINEYIESIRSEIEENFFSTNFIRLANFYFNDNKFEDCIKVCKTGISIYPNYLTAKIMLIKALLKLEYLSEAESIYSEIENKIQNFEIAEIIKKKIDSLKNGIIQERIYYPESENTVTEFRTHVKTFNSLFDEDNKIPISDYLNPKKNIILDKNSYEKFEKKLDEINLGDRSNPAEALKSKEAVMNSKSASTFSNIKFVSETLADIYAEQGNFSEAFNMYNFLLRAGSPNKTRIERKLSSLERNMIKF